MRKKWKLYVAIGFAIYTTSLGIGLYAIESQLSISGLKLYLLISILCLMGYAASVNVFYGWIQDNKKSINEL